MKINSIMKLKTTILILALSAAPAFAFDADHGAKSKTREEVKAELSQALRSGDIMAGGEIGAKVNELNSGRYQLPASGLSKTRDQVRAELQQAQRSGDLLAAGESGSKLNELQPDLYPAKVAQAGKTRSLDCSARDAATAAGEHPRIRQRPGFGRPGPYSRP